MLGHSMLFTLLALLCAGQAQECPDEESRILRDIYRNKCNQAYPNSQQMEVYLHQSDYFCIFYCSGFDSEGKFIFDLHNKDDGLKCSANIGTKEESRCLNGTCVLTSSIQECAEQIDWEVTGVEGKQCDLTCRGAGGQSVDVQKSEGTTCILEDNTWRPSKCTSYGYCETEMNFIADTDDADTTNDIMAQTVCEASHNKDVFVFRSRPDDSCEYLCYFNDTGAYDYEWMDFRNGYPCGESNTCFGGSCRKETDIETCKDLLGDSELERMDIKECTMTCVGNKSKRTKSMDENTECKKLLDGWYPAEGLCNDAGECEVDKEKYKEFLRK